MFGNVYYVLRILLICKREYLMQNETNQNRDKGINFIIIVFIIQGYPFALF